MEDLLLWKNVRSLDGALGIQPLDLRMVVADKSTELCRLPLFSLNYDWKIVQLQLFHWKQKKQKQKDTISLDKSFGSTYSDQLGSFLHFN